MIWPTPHKKLWEHERWARFESAKGPDDFWNTLGDLLPHRWVLFHACEIEKGNVEDMHIVKVVPDWHCFHCGALVPREVKLLVELEGDPLNL